MLRIVAVVFVGYATVVDGLRIGTEEGPSRRKAATTANAAANSKHAPPPATGAKVKPNYNGKSSGSTEEHSSGASYAQSANSAAASAHADSKRFSNNKQAPQNHENEKVNQNVPHVGSRQGKLAGPHSGGPASFSKDQA